jgi:serine/threonine protein kinase
MLNHPHVCVVYDVGEPADGLPFIAMEFVEGQTLEVLVTQGPLEAARIVEIVLQVADALDAAHGRGIVHRDIKPSNISLNERGQIKVLDFGLAKRIPTGTDGQGVTQDFSAGVVLYELATGRRPSRATTAAKAAAGRWSRPGQPAPGAVHTPTPLAASQKRGVAMAVPAYDADGA